MPTFYAALLAPLRVPLRAMEALTSLDDAAQEVQPIHSELTRVREQTEPLAGVMTVLEGFEDRLGSIQQTVDSLASDESHLNKAVGELGRQLAAMHESLSQLQDDVERITGRLPDPDAPGPLAKAREVITGRGD